jgi:hypothetical protein
VDLREIIATIRISGLPQPRPATGWQAPKDVWRRRQEPSCGRRNRPGSQRHGNPFGAGFLRGDEFPHPAKGFERLMLRSGAREKAGPGRLRRVAADFDAQGIEPTGNGSIPGLVTNAYYDTLNTCLRGQATAAEPAPLASGPAIDLTKKPP